MSKRMIYIFVSIVGSVLVGIFAFYFTQDRKFTIAYSMFSYSILVTVLLFFQKSTETK